MEQQKLIKIDLAETEIEPPCKKHERQGYPDPGCEECEEMDPVPGEIPELRGLWVEIRNPNLLPYGESKQLFTAKENETVGQFKERLATGLITCWNVPDATAEEPSSEPLPIPRDDPSALDRALDVVNPVYEAIAKLRRERAVPKARPISS